MPYEVHVTVWCESDALETKDQYPYVQDGIDTLDEARLLAEQECEYYLSPDGIENIRDTCPQTEDALDLVVERIEVRVRKYEDVVTISQ